MRTSIRHICGSHHSPYLLHRLQIRTQSSVHRENLFVDDCGDWQAVETISKRLPQLDVIPPLACIRPVRDGTSRPVRRKGQLTFVVKAVYPIDTRTLVISSQNEEVFGVFDLVRKEEADGLKRLLATVDVIA